jgi:hypothetical protein
MGNMFKTLNMPEHPVLIGTVRDQLSVSISKYLDMGNSPQDLIDWLDKQTNGVQFQSLEEYDEALAKFWNVKVEEFNKQCEQKRKAA